MKVLVLDVQNICSKITDYPDFVQIIDGGTLGMDLMPYIAGTKNYY